jgi:hypothetical protein
MQIEQPGDDRWRKIIIEDADHAALQLQNGRLDYVASSFSKDHAQLDMTDSDDPKWRAHFAIQQPATDLLNLKGFVNDVPVAIALRASKRSFRLTSGDYQIIRNYE